MNITHLMRTDVSIAAAILSCVTYPASAQEADKLKNSATATDTRPADGGLGEIVVTALKRAQRTQDIPVSVTALGGGELQRQGIKDLFQAVTLVPGVVFSRAPDDGLALTFRGLGTQARPQAFEQSVALFTDGVFIGKGRLYSTSFFDVDRMEFIKGTQSTLLGKNASLGAISVVTRQPGDTFSLEGRAGYEFEDGGYSLDAASDLPLGDKVALRLAAHYNDLDGWIHNSFTDHDGPEHKDFGLRATLRANLTDALTVTGSYQYADNRQIGSNDELLGGALPPIYGSGVLGGSSSQFTSRGKNGDTYHVTRSYIANLKGELAVGDHTLISQTSYIHYNLAFVDDLDFSPDDSVNFVRNERYNQFTQELRLQSPTGGSLEYMVGAFYLSSRWRSVETQFWAVPAFPPPPDPASGQLFNGAYTNDFHQKASAVSAFASGQYKITSALRILGGIRYTRETKDVIYGRTAIAPFTAWNQVVNPPFDPTPLSHDSSFIDGNVSLQYDFNRNVMAYASYGHGSKSGGFVETNTISVAGNPSVLVNGKVPAALASAGSAISDEFTSSYEVGLKTTLLDRRLRFNIAGFWTDIKNFQDTVFTGGPLGFITFNEPARSKGVEVESAFQLTPEFRLDGGFTYAKATAIFQPIDPATSAPAVDANGNPVFSRFQRSQAPKVIFNVGANYETAITDALTLKLGASTRHRSSMFNQRQEQFFSKSLTTVDLSTGIEASDKRWGIDLVAKNVGNAKSEDFAGPTIDPRFAAFYGAHFAGSNPLRTITLSVHLKY